MKVSGFTYIRNGFTYGYPFIKSIESILPICDEFVIAVGDSNDGTREAIVQLNSPKIKIIDTVWDDELREGGKIFAQQANIAFDAITGDWGFHIQADEVVHEKDLDTIYQAMKANLENKTVQGFLFHFLNFYGSYDYIGTTRRWHRKEIRIVRNDKNIRSYRDSQGFRIYPTLEDYHKGHKGIKLKAKQLDCSIFHYSYVRNPKHMSKKNKRFHSYWHNDQWVEAHVDESDFMYTEMDLLEPFKGTHPAVMKEVIAGMDWKFDPKQINGRMSAKEKFLYHVEKLTGWRIGEYKNYKKI